jgi:hypothetical protein
MVPAEVKAFDISRLNRVFSERSTVAALYTSGNQIASSFGVLLAGNLCALTFLGGWPLIFYSFGWFLFKYTLIIAFLGAVSAIYIALFFFFVTNSPNKNKFISDKERIFLNIQLSSQHSGLATKKV